MKLRKSGIIFRIIVILMIFILLVITNIVPTIAKSEINSDNENEKTTIKDLENKSDCEIVKEVVEKREENVKHFLRSDGTFEAVIYSKPIHYKEEGIWRNVDNRMY